MAKEEMYVEGSDEDPRKGKVGLELLDDQDLAAIVQAELREEEFDSKRNSAGAIAFQELAKRSGWG